MVRTQDFRARWNKQKTAFFLSLILHTASHLSPQKQRSQFSVTKNAFLSFFIFHVLVFFFLNFRHARMHFLIPHSPIHMHHNFNRNNVGTRCGYHILTVCAEWNRYPHEDTNTLSFAYIWTSLYPIDLCREMPPLLIKKHKNWTELGKKSMEPRTSHQFSFGATEISNG